MNVHTDGDLFTKPVTFMGVPSELPGPGCRAAIIGVPFDCGIHSFRVGARQGPQAVREQSALMRRFNPTHADFDPLERLGVVDCGNVKLTPGRIVDAFARIEKAASAVLAAGAAPIGIGGDGSVSLPLMRAAARQHPDMVALHIDSHTDSYPYDPANKFNASNQFTHAVEETLIDASSSWHVGIRGTTYSQGVLPRARKLGFRVVSLDDLLRRGFAQTFAEFRDQAARRPVYLCFDMDVFDPSCAPGVATPTWGGLSAREGIDLLRTLTDLNIIAVDVNTVSPPQDINNMAAHLCSHVIYEIILLLCRQLDLAD